MNLHPRYIVVGRARAALGATLDDWIRQRFLNQTGWEEPARVLSLVVAECLRFALGATIPRAETIGTADLRSAWEIVKTVRDKHGLTWREMAHEVHHEINSMLNYALRGERHPDDKTGEKKADEA